MSNDSSGGSTELNELAEEVRKVTLQDKQDDFIVVKSRKKGRKKVGENFANFNHDLGSSESTSDVVEERPSVETRAEILRKINHCVGHLRSSSYWIKFQENLEQGFEQVTGSKNWPEKLDVFCLGLGPFSSHLLSRIARYQLALLILLKEKFEAPVEVFDPVFIQQEKSILVEDFGFEVSEVNEEGKRSFERPTLIFMPHCPHQLVNNLLYANWRLESLSNCYIVCNSISEALISIPSSYVSKNLYFLREGSSICVEIPIPNVFSDHADVFNDIALHIFLRKDLTDLSESFWSDISCPKYTEEDFVAGGVKDAV